MNNKKKKLISVLDPDNVVDRLFDKVKGELIKLIAEGHSDVEEE